MNTAHDASAEHHTRTARASAYVLLDPATTGGADWSASGTGGTRDSAASGSGGVAEVAALEGIALRVGLEAAGLIRQMREELVKSHGSVMPTETKSSAVDPVTDVDRASEELIRRRLREEAPGSAVLGEEQGSDAPGISAPAGAVEAGESAEPVLWVVDPIDGTVNFMYGLPAYAVSIAATRAGVPIAAAVIDVPAGLAYVAHCSGPARLLDCSATLAEHRPGVAVPAPRELRVLRGPGGGGAATTSGAGGTQGHVTGSSDAAEEGAARAALAGSLVAAGFSYLAARRQAQAELLNSVLPQVRDIRRMGSAALDLCHLADGDVDCYYEHGLGPWDHCAGALIAARSGVTVRMPALSLGSESGALVMAAKPEVFDYLYDLLVEAASGVVLKPLGTARS